MLKKSIQYIHKISKYVCRFISTRVGEAGKAHINTVMLICGEKHNDIQRRNEHLPIMHCD